MRDGGGPIRALWAVAAAGIEGERERELRGFDPLPHLERRWHVAARSRWPAAAGGGGSGGGARGAEEGLRRRGWLVVAKSVAEAPFIGEMRRWGWGEPVAAGRRPLMAPGAAAARFTARRDALGRQQRRAQGVASCGVRALACGRARGAVAGRRGGCTWAQGRAGPGRGASGGRRGVRDRVRGPGGQRCVRPAKRKDRNDKRKRVLERQKILRGIRDV